MSEVMLFTDCDEFVAQLRRMIDQGVPKDRIQVRMPYPIREAEELLLPGRGWVRVFTLAGASAGFLIGVGFTIYTVLSWPLITGGKPLISIPPFLLIAYILTILFGSLASFLGFFLLSILPKIHRVVSPLEEYGNQFVIRTEETR